MGKVNWKILNAALWIEVILSYLMPFHVTDASSYQVGFPIPFITVYETKPGINPFMSMHLNPIGLVFNGILIYLLISVCMKAYQKFRCGHAK